MAGTCEICGKTVTFGRNVSFSKRRTNRAFRPNIQKTRVLSSGQLTQINACTRCIKTLAKPGIELDIDKARKARA
ncbi:MAG TPA: 50S ribosomal protein L28 [Thermomicrobiales bacterium]|jgi:large subunit ribosomal protein L28|nr:50S ribosomal protein L28 [Chloroflexota bacterium]HBY45117.1 50S ribosomal protein L28 [Chloroflexota bacterium]HCG29773.1 50S ribosomal protein L28 [Chloroflexota bacterium]HQZ90625.1 50S ribosomal protein L28 [Thermomicrobiales bacterium]HRA31533.1 50S ribosomal protein L28 [Thermomicrobiales bacterium]